MRPLIVPIFIAHQGCPHRCIFCDQHSITGRSASREGEMSPGEAKKTIETWLSRPRKHPEAPVQVAFYGGSFTGLAKARQKELLKVVRPFIKSGRVDMVRISTRPDYIDHETALFLQDQGVGCVELGVQSMNPEVLAACARGYTGNQVERAVECLKTAAFAVGIQLMVGLPHETTPKLIDSAKRIAALQPDFVRIYPTLVLRKSVLHRLFACGQYRPLSLNQAIARTVRIKRIFDHHGIQVIRIGLQPSSALAREVVAGPYHAAFGELVLSRSFLKALRGVLARVPPGQMRRVSIASADESVLRGPKNCNMKRFAVLGLLQKMELVFDSKQQRGMIQTEDIQWNGRIKRSIRGY